MNQKIEQILQELIANDPTLKEKRTELAKIINFMLQHRPDAEIDPHFQASLKTRLMARFIEKSTPRQKFLKIFHSRVTRGIMGGVVLGSLVLIVTFNLYRTQKEEVTFSKAVYVKETDREKQNSPQPQVVRPSAEETRGVDEQNLSGIMTDEKKLETESPQKLLTENNKTKDTDLGNTKSISTKDMASLDDIQEKSEGVSVSEMNDQDIAVKQESESYTLKMDKNRADSALNLEDQTEKKELKFAKKKSGPLFSKNKMSMQKSPQAEPREEVQQSELSPSTTYNLYFKNSGPGGTVTQGDPLDFPFIPLPVSEAEFNYPVQRKMIQEGSNPGKALSVSQWVNGYYYDYPLPERNTSLRFTTVLLSCPWNSDHQLLQVGLQTSRPQVSSRPAILVLVVDLKDEKNIPVITESIMKIALQLHTREHLAIVLFSGAEQKILEPTSDPLRIREFLATFHHSTRSSILTGIRDGLALTLSDTRQDVIQKVIVITDKISPIKSDLVVLKDILTDQKYNKVLKSVWIPDKTPVEHIEHNLIQQAGFKDILYLNSPDQFRMELLRSLDRNVQYAAQNFQTRVEFNPLLVKHFELLGYNSPEADITVPSNLEQGYQQTWLFEITPRDKEENVPMERLKQTIYQNHLAVLKYQYYDPLSSQNPQSSILVKNEILMWDSIAPAFDWSAALAWWGKSLNSDSTYMDYALLNKIAARGMTGQIDTLRQDFMELLKSQQGHQLLRIQEKPQVLETK